MSDIKVQFWGSRGSIPASFCGNQVRLKIFKALEAARGLHLDSEKSINEFIDQTLPFSVSNSFGSNTSCVQIAKNSDEYLICDAGSGIRDFAVDYFKSGFGIKSSTFHILISHLHWDHIQGFPFFAPAFIPGNKIIFHGYHDTIEPTFRNQMQEPWFPVNFDDLAADIEFNIMKPCEPFSLCGFDISSIEQQHPGVSYGYRFLKNGKSVVYSTDSEHNNDAYKEDYPFINFFKDADLLIFDAQYSLADATFTKVNWGHSSNVMGVELAARSKVKTLCMFHNEPTCDDFELEEFLLNTKMYGDIYHSEVEPDMNDKQYPENIILAYDGLIVEL